MDHVLVVVGCEDTDLEESANDVGADEHGEVGLGGSVDRADGVVDGVTNVVSGDLVSMGTRQDLHT